MKQIVIRSYQPRKSIIIPIIFLIVGALLFANPGGIVEFLSYILGGVFLALGVLKFVKDIKSQERNIGDTFYSFIMIAIGLIFIFFSGTLEFLMRLIIGLWISINGINTIIIGTNMMRFNKKNVFSLIIGIILLLMGIYTIFVSNLILSTLGLVIIFYSVLDIADYIYNYFKNR